MLVVVVLLGWSFRGLGRTFTERAGVFRVLANVALTGVLLIAALTAVAWAALISVAGQ